MQFYQFMAKTLLTFLFLFFTPIIFSQVNTLRDALVLKIPQANTYTTTGISDYIKQIFSTDTDRIRAFMFGSPITLVMMWLNYRQEIQMCQAQGKLLTMYWKRDLQFARDMRWQMFSRK